MFKLKGFSILILWILMFLVDSKPIGICKTYFSIIGIEGNSLNGQALCSRTEIPFVYFVLKCNDSNSLKCAKNVQWSALSVCDKANVHHEEIPVTTALNTIDTSELSMELSLFIQTEDEVRSVDEFTINTKVDPNDENLKTFVDSVGKLHKTQLEVEFHRVCSLPDKLKSPRQVISYLLRNHPKRRRKRAAATLEYADPGLSELQPSVSSNNGNPYLRDPFPLSKTDTEVGVGQINNVLPYQRQTTTEEPYKQFWSKIAKFSQVNTTTDSAPSITIGLRNPYVTPAKTLTPYPGSSKSTSALNELLSRDKIFSDVVNQDTFTVPSTSSNPRVTARFITRPAVTVPSTTSPSSSSSMSRLLSSTSATTTSITTARKTPTPQTSPTTSPTSTTSTTSQTFTTPSTTSTTTISSPSTTLELPTSSKSIKPQTPIPTLTTTTTTKTTPPPPTTTTATTEKQQSALSTRVQNTVTTSPTTTSVPRTTKQTTEMVTTKQPTLKPMVDDVTEISTTKEENTTENRISTEPSINTPLPSGETDTSASSSSSRMEGSGTDTSGGDDNFWPIVAAMVIGIPSVIVFAIAITVIHKKRLGRAPRFMSSSMYPSL
ncbi:hypothetical protein LOTGIDRAFT_166412 [Lottia gigantea]|uniref:Uncharacterized protein n=1 Tax=Lottia gigantea TaxID=225164 RepID=V3ZY18_LOTGI|nr:hypothetical protein LOTGIDRAFT_166412 [Lottia gigantea]ESO87530.1 hypothetical protein LOTGIDRAFT_166412 [Lottia gigantea]